MLGIERERFRGLHGLRCRVGMREHEARHAIGERRLADAGARRRSARHAECGRRDRLEQRPLGLRVAEEDSGLARMRRLQVAVVVFRCAHCGISSSNSGAVAGSSRAFTIVQICSATVSRGSAVSTSTQRLRLARRQAADRLRAASRGSRAPRSRSGRPPSSPRRPLARVSPTSADMSRMMVRSGFVFADRDPLQPLDQPRIDVAEHALIDARGIGEAVADHPAAARQAPAGWCW